MHMKKKKKLNIYFLLQIAISHTLRNQWTQQYRKKQSKKKNHIIMTEYNVRELALFF